MKNISLFFLALTFIISNACDHKADVWTEMEEYHRLMSETYHPFEEGNMDPIKNEIDNLVNAAENWANSKPPVSMEREGMEQKLEKLKNETSDLSRLIEDNAENEMISTQFEELHDLFHQIKESYSAHEH